MHWSTLYLIYTFCFFVGIYLVSTIVLALFAKFEEDDNGRLRLDVESWHFKVAFPAARYERWFWRVLEENRFPITSCTYRRRFAHGLFIIWPLIIFYATLGFIILTPMSFLAAHYPKFSMRAFNNKLADEELQAPGFVLRPIEWLKFKRFTLYPFTILILGLYLWNFAAVNGAFVSKSAMSLYSLLPGFFLLVAYIVAAIIAVIAVIGVIVALYLKLKDTEKKTEEGKKVSVVWVSIKSWYDKVCYPLDAYNIEKGREKVRD